MAERMQRDLLMRLAQMENVHVRHMLSFCALLAIILYSTSSVANEIGQFSLASQNGDLSIANEVEDSSDPQKSDSFPIFGDFTWNDTLPDVLLRISQLPGIEEVTLNLQAGYTPKTIDITREYEIAKLSDKIGRVKGSMDIRSRFVSATGEDSEYRDRDIAFRVTPIAINGVSFDLKLTLRACPMIAVAFPAKAPIHGDTGVALSYLLTDVELGEVSINGCADGKLSEMIELLKNKYPALAWTGTDGEAAIARTPDGSSALSISCLQRIMISYSSTSQLEFYKKLYGDHVRKIDTVRLEHRPDFSDQL